MASSIVLLLATIGVGFSLFANLRIVKIQDFKSLFVLACKYVKSLFTKDKSDNQLSPSKKTGYDEVINADELKKYQRSKVENLYAYDKNCLFYGKYDKKNRLLLAFEILENFTIYSHENICAAKAEIRSQFHAITREIACEIDEVFERWGKYNDEKKESKSELFESLYRMDVKEKTEKACKYTNLLIEFIRDSEFLTYEFKQDYSDVPQHQSERNKYDNNFARMQKTIFSMKKSLAEYYGIKIPGALQLGNIVSAKAITYYAKPRNRSKSISIDGGSDNSIEHKRPRMHSI